MKRDAQLRLLAENQLGLVHRRQLREMGYSNKQLTRLTRGEVLESLAKHVFRLVGSPHTLDQRLLAAVFDAGNNAGISHTTAGAVWRVGGLRPTPIHVTRARSGPWRSSLAIVHEPVLLLAEHITMRGPIPVTSPSQTLFDIAGMVDRERLARAVDDAIVSRLTNARALHRMLEVRAKRGRPGIANMRAVLDERGIDYRAPESNLERRFMQKMAEAGMPEFERQVDVGDELGWIARVDFLCAALRLIIFVDGDRWHSMLVDRAADERQMIRLERAGSLVWRIPEALVFGPTARLVASVRQAFALARKAS